MAKATGPTYTVPFKRRRKKITNYKKRLALIKSGLPRMVIRSSNKTIEVQFTKYTEQGDKIITSVNSNNLKKYGWNPKRNSPTAYLTSYLCALKAKEQKISKFVLDIGMTTPSKGAISFVGCKGAIDAGLDNNLDEEKIIEDRVNGKHIEEYAKKLKETDEDKYKKIFASYIEKGIKPEEISKTFEEVLGKLKKGDNK